MKYILILTWTVLGSVLPSPAGLVSLREHVDVHLTYTPEDGWTSEAKTVAEGSDFFQEFDAVSLPLDDEPSATGGQRLEQPEAPEFAFTGVAPGSPLWVAPQIQTPDQCWPGFNNNQATGTFGAYQETDLRLPAEDRALALPWLKLTLLSVTRPGSDAGAFSMWQTDGFGTPTVWFSTADQSHPDTFLFVAGGHVHLNWGFGSPGIYRIRLAASAFLGPGQSNPTGSGPPFTVTFAIGPFAQWQTTHFSASELDQPAICGPDADPDQDGMKNLVEFAFGYNPRNGNAEAVAAGLGLPEISLIEDGGTFYEVLKYPQRRAAEQIAPISYNPQFANSLAVEDWKDSGIVTEVTNFPAAQNSLNPVWEKVTCKRPTGQARPSRGFARVMLVSTPE